MGHVIGRALRGAQRNPRPDPPDTDLPQLPLIEVVTVRAATAAPHPFGPCYDKACRSCSWWSAQTTRLQDRLLVAEETVRTIEANRCPA